MVYCPRSSKFGPEGMMNIVFPLDICTKQSQSQALGGGHRPLSLHGRELSEGAVV